METWWSPELLKQLIILRTDQESDWPAIEAVVQRKAYNCREILNSQRLEMPYDCQPYDLNPYENVDPQLTS